MTSDYNEAGFWKLKRTFQIAIVGKTFIIIGFLLIGSGLVLILAGRFGFFRVPETIEIQGKNWKIHFPLTDCILLSVVLTILMWLIRIFRKEQ